MLEIKHLPRNEFLADEECQRGVNMDRVVWGQHSVGAAHGGC